MIIILFLKLIILKLTITFDRAYKIKATITMYTINQQSSWFSLSA